MIISGPLPIKFRPEKLILARACVGGLSVLGFHESLILYFKVQSLEKSKKNTGKTKITNFVKNVGRLHKRNHPNEDDQRKRK